jgi:hypothetical protein
MLEFRGMFVSYAPQRRTHKGQTNMSASSLVYLKTAEASQVRLPEAKSARAKKIGWRKLSFFRSRPPTTFQLSLALHMFVAERYGALD